MFNVNACDIRQIPRPSNNDHNKIGSTSRKDQQRVRTEESAEQENTALRIGKIARINLNSTPEAGSSSTNNSVTSTALRQLEDRNIHQRSEESNLPEHSRFITLKLTNDSFDHNRLGLHLIYMRRHGLTKPGNIGLVSQDGTKLMVKLLQDRITGRMRIGKGWKEFAIKSGLQIGESFTLELIWEGSTPMFRLSSIGTDSECDKTQERNCSQACEEESPHIEPMTGNGEKKDKNNIEDQEYFSSLENRARVLTLTLKPKDVKDGELILPMEFMIDNGIDKLVKITILGKANMEWWGFRPSKSDGIITVGYGWGNFCKANGINTGDVFTLAFIRDAVDTGPVFRICPNSRD